MLCALNPATSLLPAFQNPFFLDLLFTLRTTHKDTLQFGNILVTRLGQDRPVGLNIYRRGDETQCHLWMRA